MKKKNIIRTSKEQASKAAKTLSDPKASKLDKSLAADVLVNRKKST